MRPRIEKEQVRFDTLFTANEYLEGVELSADRLLASYDSRESEVARIESEALELILSQNIIKLQTTDNQVQITTQSKTKCF